MDLSRLVSERSREVVELRRDFHRHPELGTQEFRTAERVAGYLQACGLEVHRVTGTGVVGLLRGARPGPTLLLRADLDALPIQEENDVPYRSVHDGVMHACGHDAHTATLLVAARILSGLKGRLAGNVKFVFEPNEEHVGALAMIESGVMNHPRVDACMALHYWTPLRTGQLGITEGPVMAGMEHFELIVKGRGGHTATPQTAIDPILAAAAVVLAVQSIQTREVDVLREPTVIMFGTIAGGTASNIIPDTVTLSGTMRYFFTGEAQSQDHPKRRLERVVSRTCAAHRAGHELSFLYGHPTLVNHAGMVALARSVASTELSPAPEIVSFSTLAGEDFSEFASRAPGVFCFVGAGNPEKGTDFPHHHPRFDLDEDALPVGVELLVRSALRFFEQASDLSFPSKRC